jgi:hypothetical protein
MAISLALALQSDSKIVTRGPQVMAYTVAMIAIAKFQYVWTLFTEPLPVSCTPASPTYLYSPRLLPPQPGCHKSRPVFRSVLAGAWAIATGSVLADLGCDGVGLTSCARKPHERLRNGPDVFRIVAIDTVTSFVSKPQPHRLDSEAMGQQARAIGRKEVWLLTMQLFNSETAPGKSTAA